MVQFEWSISMGQILTMLTIVGTGLHLHKKLVVFDAQLAMIWADYVKRHGLDGSPPQTCAAHYHYRAGDAPSEKKKIRIERAEHSLDDNEER
jgi:hypothetical protein